jgi:YD repeat-containing protein
LGTAEATTELIFFGSNWAKAVSSRSIAICGQWHRLGGPGQMARRVAKLAGAVVLVILAFYAADAQTGNGPVTYVYDDLGRLIGVVDAQGNAARYSYDAVGNILSISRIAAGQVAIINFTPSSGPVGTTVVISGTGFSALTSQNSVQFNGVSATVNSATTTQIVATVPAAATTGLITVTTPNGSATSSSPFTVATVSGAPTITGFTPVVGSPGTTVTLTGTNFQANATRVRFNITDEPGGSVTSGTSMTTTVPGSTSSGRITLSTMFGKTTSSQDFYIPFGSHTAADVGFTQRITWAGTSNVSFAAANKIGLVIFDAAAGQVASVQLTPGTLPSCTVYLFDPHGNQVASNAWTGSSTEFYWPPLLMTGTYTIGIDAGTNSGNFSVTLNNLSPLPPPSRPSGSVLDPSNPLSTYLAGLFLMNEGAGSTDLNLVDNQVANFSGNSLPAWNTGDPSIVFGGGSSLNSYLNAGTDLTFDDLTPGQMTVVAKVYVNTVAAGGMCEKNDGNSSDSGFVFGWDSTGAIKLTVERFSGNMRVASAPGAISTGQWMQVAFTWDGSVGAASAAHLFLNGVEQTKASATDGSGTIGFASATNQPFRIGNASFDFPGSLSGKMAYLAVYKGRILTPTELSELDAQLPTDTIDISESITPNSSPLTVTTATAGQKARLLFSANLGQIAIVQLSNNTIGSVTVSLVQPNGTALTSVSSSAGSFALPGEWLPISGTYAILVQANGSNTGSIAVAVTVTNLQPRPVGSMIDTNSPLSNNLAGLFLMNEGTGTYDENLVDGQVANFAGTSLPTWNTSDPSVVFNGGSSLNSYLNAGTDLIFDDLTPGQMTVVAKVYVSAAAAAGICEKNDGDTIDSGFAFGLSSSGAVSLVVEKSGSDMQAATGAATVPTGQWVQLAFTWDGTIGNSSAAHLYLDGVEQTKVNPVDGSGTIGYANATQQPFRIGNDSLKSPGALNGKVAYLAVYKGRILTPTEMDQLDAQLPLLANNDIVGSITPNGASVPLTTTTAGQNARLSFYARTEQRATVQLTNNTMGSVTVSLITPNSTLSSVTSSSSSFTLPDTWLPITGVYTIYIQPANTGSITVGVTVTNLQSRPVGSTLNTSSPLATNLAGLFLMNEGTGTSDENLVDGQVANFAGTSLPTWNTGDPSVAFNGGSSLNSYLNAGTDLTFDDLTPGKMTFVAKVYVSTVAAAGVCEKNDGDVNSGFAFGWAGTGALHLVVVKTGTDMQVASASGVISSGQWVQVAFTWDGTIGNASAAHLFLDGVEQAKTSSTDGSGTIDYQNATNKPFRIGNASFDFSGSLNGKMAYLAVYKGRILSTTEMNELDASLPIQ